MEESDNSAIAVRSRKLKKAAEKRSHFFAHFIQFYIFEIQYILSNTFYFAVSGGAKGTRAGSSVTRRSFQEDAMAVVPSSQFCLLRGTKASLNNW